MAAATTNIVGKYRPSGGPFVTMKQAAEKIPAGALVMVNAAGYAANATDTANCYFLGVATEFSDNSAGSAGDKSINVDVGGASVLVTHEDGSLAQANVGDSVVQELNNEVTSAGTADQDIAVGVIESVPSATTCWVKCRPFGVAS